MFEDRTQEAIKAEMLSLIKSATGLSTLAGSFADAAIGAAADEISQLYQALPAVTSMLFVDETSGGYIDLVGTTYFDITRRSGTRARCDIALTGDPSTRIPAGTIFRTATLLQFSLLNEVVLGSGGTGVGVLEAAEEGSAYNVGEGAIVSMYVNVPGLASYHNEQAVGGTDTESDADLLQRITERRQKPVNGANGWQYRAWALEVSGVGEAKVVELSQGPGSVGISLVDTNMAPASPEIVEACQSAIDAQRPVGAAVYVDAPEALEISLEATVVISGATTAETVRQEMERRLSEYLESLIREKYSKIYYAPEEDGAYTVIYNRILALLLTIDGVANANALTVNGGTEDITVSAGQVPTLGGVEVGA